MRVLLTAFDPFDGTGENASQEACRLFLRQWAEEWDLEYRLLPTHYGADTSVVQAALAEGTYDVLLHTGQYTGAGEVRVERLAVNVRFLRDSGVHGAPHAPIDPDGPTALFSTLPVDEVAAAIETAGVPAVVTNHAGIYLCNHVLYQSLRAAEKLESRPRVGFLHVPCLPAQAGAGRPSLDAELSARAIRAALAHLDVNSSRSPFRST